MSKEYPFEMHHLAYGSVLVQSDGDVENCLKNGFSYDPPEKTNSAFIKSKIASLQADIAQLQLNLITAEEAEAKAEEAEVEVKKEETDGVGIEDETSGEEQDETKTVSEGSNPNEKLVEVVKKDKEK